VCWPPVGQAIPARQLSFGMFSLRGLWSRGRYRSRCLLRATVSLVLLVGSLARALGWGAHQQWAVRRLVFGLVLGRELLGRVVVVGGVVVRFGAALPYSRA